MGRPLPDEALFEQYRRADEERRLAVLHEILRLEPVVGRLRRRTTARLELPGADGPVAIPAGELVEIPVGELVEILVDDANTDPHTVGPRPLSVCPGRAMDATAGGPALSFGDGPHRCPGAVVAVLETDIFLSRLFALDGIRMVTAPRVTLKDEIGGYEIRDLTVAIDRA